MFKKILYLFTIYCSLIIVSNYLDPDFGWHLRIGQIISSTGIPKIDPLSYTMPYFVYVDHSWLTDVLIAKLFPRVNFIGLSIIVSFISLVSLVVAVRGKVVSPFFVLAAATLLSSVAIRPLVISWLFFSIQIYMFSDKVKYLRWKYLLPIFFLLWSNLHGGFLVGLLLSLIFLFARTIDEKKIPREDFFIFILCMGTTLINPYNFDLWREVLSSIFDPRLRSVIIEWTPTMFIFDPSVVAFIVFSSTSIIKYRNRFSLFQKISFVILLASALSSARNIPFFVFLALPVTFSGYQFFIKTPKVSQERLYLLNKFLWIGSIGLYFLVLANVYYHIKKYNENDYYPGNAVSYLKGLDIRGQIFSPYDWGGFLDWKLPEKQVFIDGRMPSWKGIPSNNNQSYDAFSEQLNVVSAKLNFDIIFDKYGVNYVLWQKRSAFLVKLENSGWYKIYEDNVAVVYTKNR